MEALWEVLRSAGVGPLDSELTSILTALCPDLLEAAGDRSPLSGLLQAHGWDAGAQQFTGPVDRLRLAKDVEAHLTPVRVHTPPPMVVLGKPPRSQPRPRPQPRPKSPPQPTGLVTRSLGLQATDTYYSPARRP